MHIEDGILSAPVMIAGTTVCVAGLVMGMRKLNSENLPQVAMLSAASFVITLLHIPVGPASVHMLLNGLVGLMLGWLAFPAVFVGMLLDAFFLGFGGIGVLGVNTVNVALPAVLIGIIYRHALPRQQGAARQIWAFLVGFSALLLTGVMAATSIALSGEAFIPAAKLLLGSHLLIAVLEGFVTAAALTLVLRVRPHMLDLPAT